jgi:hypothetical protein
MNRLLAWCAQRNGYDGFYFAAGAIVFMQGVRLSQPLALIVGGICIFAAIMPRGLFRGNR